MNKLDESLVSINNFLTALTERINPNTILGVAMVNGFILGLVTTGYLGANSVSTTSWNFGLIIWQFAVICVFSSKYIKLSTEYLVKFFLAVVIGYHVQWQIFGIYVENNEPEKLKFIEPFMSNNNGNFIFVLFFLMGVKYCFSGNVTKEQEPLIDTKT